MQTEQFNKDAFAEGIQDFTVHYLQPIEAANPSASKMRAFERAFRGFIAQWGLWPEAHPDALPLLAQLRNTILLIIDDRVKSGVSVPRELYWSIGLIAVLSEDFTGAERLFEEAIRSDVNYVSAYISLGKVLLQLGRTDKAIERYNAAIAINPNEAKIYNNRGTAFLSIGQVEKASNDFKEAIRLKPGYFEAMVNLGAAHMQKTRYDEAKEAYEQVAAAFPDAYPAHMNMATALHKMQEYGRAEAKFEEIIAKFKDIAIIHINFGSLYDKWAEKLLEAGDPVGARKAYQAAIKQYKIASKIEPANAYTRLVCGDTYMQLAKLTKAKQNYELAIRQYAGFFKYSTTQFAKQRAQAKIRNIRYRISDLQFRRLSELLDRIETLLRFKGEHLTHYTGLSAAGFLVLRWSGMRISEGTYMNDIREGHSLFDFLAPALDDGRNGGKSRSQETRRLTHKPFIGSFVASSKQMDDNLDLWRWYGKEGGEEANGVSITINVKRFQEALLVKFVPGLNQSERQMRREEFRFYRVAYYDDRKFMLQAAEPGKIAEQESKVLTELLFQLRNTLTNAKEETRNRIWDRLVNLAYLFKSASFRQEHEVRLVLPEVGFRPVVDLHYPIPRVYIEIASLLQSISKVTIGPKVDRKEEWSVAFRYHLRQSYLDAEVATSALHYK